MIAAISPVSLMNLTPIMPVALPGIAGGGLLPTAGAALSPTLSTIVALAGATNVPTTYTASGSFRTSVQITPGAVVPGTGTTPFTQRIHLEFDADLDLLIVRDRASANSPLSALPPDTIRILADAMTTDLLLASLGSSNGTTGNLAAQALGGIFGNFGSPLTGNNLFGNTLLGNPLNGATTLAGNNAVTSVTGTVATNLTLTIGAPQAANDTPAVAVTPTALTAAVPATATPPVATTPATPAAVAAPAAATVTLTAAPPAPTPVTAAANDTTLQRFLTDAAARALDTVANNPTYAAAAASLYASVAVFRGPEVTALTADAVRQVGPAAAVQPLPSSVA